MVPGWVRIFSPLSLQLVVVRLIQYIDSLSLDWEELFHYELALAHWLPGYNGWGCHDFRTVSHVRGCGFRCCSCLTLRFWVIWADLLMYSLGAWCSKKKSNLALFSLAWRQRYDEFIIFTLYFAWMYYRIVWDYLEPRCILRMESKRSQRPNADGNLLFMVAWQTSHMSWAPKLQKNQK